MRSKRAFYKEQQDRIAAFAKKVYSGEISNEKGEKFTEVVQIGIGGSDLGPRALYIALENWARAHQTLKMRARFISNVDPDDAAAVLNATDLAHALFIVVSKSGTTLETLTNETFVKNALTREGLNPAKHMLAVTSETSPLAKNEGYLAAFFMDDYIGGRYSSSSAVGGAVLSLAFGPEVFAEILEGMHEEDKLALNRNLLENPEMLDALIGVYERNVLGYQTTAVLPYSQALSRFPAHLQQLDMESGGKSVNRFGEPVRRVRSSSGSPARTDSIPSTSFSTRGRTSSRCSSSASAATRLVWTMRSRAVQARRSSARMSRHRLSHLHADVTMRTRTSGSAEIVHPASSPATS